MVIKNPYHKKKKIKMLVGLKSCSPLLTDFITTGTFSSCLIIPPSVLNTRDANGNVAQKSLIPIIDPYQQQTNVVALKTPFRIDGFTKLIIQSVSANSTSKFYFYPADNINLSRALGGNSVSRQFGTPPVTNGQTIRIKA